MEEFLIKSTIEGAKLVVAFLLSGLGGTLLIGFIWWHIARKNIRR